MTNEPHPVVEKRVYETRWWLWCVAVATFVGTADVRRRLDRDWDGVLLLEAFATLVALVVTCSLWRGKVVSGFLVIAVGLCFYKALQVVLDHW
ncbi:hypothetical protein EDF46_0848 [Frondihabitans sp. PhB188]|uniref:hypothetical protein n=1 Tax=Frondihabitans sp. PhB188 TaxID=2485200 RepID=UPI000F8FC937|nr:hypothetical protein [Frondihabitans sp. PhB188]ROQ41469.1 hypothetical protein EDF46_0848 [Frondihabitans sp. PhB188]